MLISRSIAVWEKPHQGLWNNSEILSTHINGKVRSWFTESQELVVGDVEWIKLTRGMTGVGTWQCGAAPR